MMASKIDENVHPDRNLYISSGVTFNAQLKVGWSTKFYIEDIPKCSYPDVRIQ